MPKIVLAKKPTTPQVSPVLQEQWSIMGPGSSDVTRLRDQVYYLERATDALCGQNVEVASNLQELEASISKLGDELTNLTEVVADMREIFEKWVKQNEGE